MKKSEINKFKKTVKKTAKKNPKAFLAVVVLLVVAAIAAALLWFFVFNKPESDIKLNGAAVKTLEINEVYKEEGATANYEKEDITSEIKITYHLGKKDGEIKEAITTEEIKVYFVEYSVSHEDFSKTIYRQVNVGTEPISINFLELGNQFTGDCTYIKAGSTDILIDAGSRQSSAETIANFLNQPGRVDDGIIEYVIATHAHQDHISAFVGTKNVPGILDRYQIKNLIKYNFVKNETELSKKFDEKINTIKEKGTVIYNASDLVGEPIIIAGGTSMEILDQKYYHELSNDENNHSVCTLITQNTNHYLFTGDLEKEGESSLVDMNSSLPKVQLFKGAHHGSYTANTDKLLSVIQPEVVCICCCAGQDEYTSDMATRFPAQEAVNRIAKYTDKVYVTTLSPDGHSNFESMNGNITLTSPIGKEYEVHGSNNDTLLKDTSWFKNNRTAPPGW